MRIKPVWLPPHPQIITLGHTFSSRATISVILSATMTNCSMGNVIRQQVSDEEDINGKLHFDWMILFISINPI